jgi:parallel beta-helix repeat protein
MKTKVFALLTLALLGWLNAQVSILLAQGSLTPPGAPAPTMKSLDQIEPRTPISALPFAITNSGSYYLTTNLVTAGSGITISASGVTLDLMGFELAGGNTNGINVSGAVNNLAIRNGTVRGWTNSGIHAVTAVGIVLQDLRVSGNSYGINAGASATVSGCAAYGNRFAGIWVGDGSTVSGCTASASGVSGMFIFPGIAVGMGSAVTGCTAFSNTAWGIIVGEGSTVSGCTARGNGDDGINAGVGCTVTGCTSSANSGDGIEVSSSCRVVENTCVGNGVGAGAGAGIQASSSRNRIDSNQVMGNDTGIQCNPATANLIIRNSARGNTTTNYNILAGNNSGAIIFVPGVGFSGTNAWANFEF